MVVSKTHNAVNVHVVNGDCNVARRRAVVVPPPVPDQHVWDVRRPEQPGYVVEDALVGGLDGILHVHPAANHILWWLSFALTVITSIIYLLKVVFYFDAVRREFHHPFRVNFFFAPCITWLFLIKFLPCPNWEIHQVVWYLLMAPILCLDLMIYGQWMSSSDRRLSKVANPLNHLAVVGNFVGGELGTRMGLRELPIFFSSRASTLHCALCNPLPAAPH